MLEYSRKFKSEQKKTSLEPQERAIADLEILGWRPLDAYIAVGLYNPIYSDEHHLSALEEITTSGPYGIYKHQKQKTMLSTTKKAQPQGDGEEEQEEQTSRKFRSKEGVIDELISTLPGLRGKEKADVLMKIADLQQMKKEETIEEDNTVHFYLPLSCHRCSLYLEAQKKHKRKKAQTEEE